MALDPVNLGREAIEKNGWFSAHKWLLARRSSQLAILGLFLIGPATGTNILKGNLSSSLLLDWVPMTDPFLFVQMLAAGFWGLAGTAVLGAAIVFAGYVLVGGRVYCSWVCPVNIVTDVAAWLRRKLQIKTKLQLKRSMGLWMLALVMGLAFATGSLAFELINPVSTLHRGLIFGMSTGWALIAAVFLFDLFVMKQGWCGHVCPMGAFYGLIGKASLLRVSADARAACDDCMECFVICPEPQVITPALRGAAKGVSPIIISGDCTNCGRCIDICAENVFHFGWRFSDQEGAKAKSQDQLQAKTQVETNVKSQVKPRESGGARRKVTDSKTAREAA